MTFHILGQVSKHIAEFVVCGSWPVVWTFVILPLSLLWGYTLLPFSIFKVVFDGFRERKVESKCLYLSLTEGPPF